MPCGCNKTPNGIKLQQSNDRSSGVTLTSSKTGKHFQLYPQTGASRSSGLIRSSGRVDKDKEERRRLRRERKKKEERRQKRKERKEKEHRHK